MTTVEMITTIITALTAAAVTIMTVYFKRGQTDIKAEIQEMKK